MFGFLRDGAETGRQIRSIGRRRGRGLSMDDLTSRQAAIQPEQQHGRVFKGVVVEYPSYNIYPEYIGKPYFSIKYTENGQEFIGYGTYKPEVLSEYLKEDFMPSAQPEQKWIPCSERVPDNYDYQLLTEEVHYTTGKIVRCVLIAYYDDEDDVWMSAEESPEAISYPIAWMPLPEAYEGGDPE